MATTFSITGGAIPTAKKVILYGPEGIGKTTFAAKFPEPVFIDTEHSTDAYDVNRMPYPMGWNMLIEEINYIMEHPNLCRTLIVDTADWAERMCVAQLLTEKSKTSIEDFGYGKGYVMVAEKWQQLLRGLEAVKNQGVNVVLTAHAAMRKFEQPDEMGSYDRWELKLNKHIAPPTKEWADMILFANYETIVVKDNNGKGKAQGNKRVMYTQHHACWDAKNRYGLNEKLPFNYDEIAHLFPAMERKESDFIEDEPAKEPKILPEYQKAIDTIRMAGLDFKVYQNGAQINAKDQEGIIHSFWPGTGTIVFNESLEKTSRKRSVKDMNVDRFIKALQTEKLVKTLFK